MVETPSSAGAAFKAVYDQWPKEERERLAPRLRALSEAVVELQAFGRDWEAEAGGAMPTTIEEWQRLAVRAGIPAEVLWGTDWSPAKIAPIILGYLDRIRDANRPEAAPAAKLDLSAGPDKATVRFGENYLRLTPNEELVLTALCEKSAATLSELRKDSGDSHADRTLKQLVKKYPALQPFIKIPGGNNRGGYSTSIKIG